MSDRDNGIPVVRDDDGVDINFGLRSLFQNSWGSRVFEGVSGLGVGQAGAGSYLNSLIS